MLTSRGQENIVHARPTAGKALLPKTPSNFQTPRTTNRAPLGAKTTNAKAQINLNDKKNAKIQVFQTPAPGQRKVPAERTAQKLSTTRGSRRLKTTVAPTEPAEVDVLTRDLEDDEPDFGYAPPAPIELPDPPMEFPYDQTFPQFRPENMFRGYGEIYHGSPKDKNGFSIRLKKEEEEYHRYLDQQAIDLTRKLKDEPFKPSELSDDELPIEKFKTRESNPDTTRAKSAALALSGIKLPSAATKQTASSRLKINKPELEKFAPNRHHYSSSTCSRPLSVSKNTIGFPKARNPPSIIPHPSRKLEAVVDNTEMLADDLSEFENFQPIFDDDDDAFQLPIPE